MSIIYFHSNINKTASRLLKVIKTAAPKERIELYQSIEELSKRLRQPSIKNNDIAILILSINEIHYICSIKYLSNNIRIILILSDSAVETIAAACRLHPRYTGYMDSNFKDISMVLKKMINKKDKGQA